MAPLPEADRRRVARKVASLMNEDGPLGLTKVELEAAVSGLDDWLETTASSANLSIPQPARGVLTAPQKAALLAYVALTRFGG